MTEQDEKDAEEQSKEILTTKDGRPELGAEDLITEDEKQDDDDEFDDDDSSSAVGSPGSSSVDTPGSSSGVEGNKIRENRLQQTQGDENEQSIQTAIPNVGDGIVQVNVTGKSFDDLLAQNSMVSVFQLS